MKTIIQQITLNLAKKITEKAYSGGISDIDALATDVLEDCKAAARAIIEAITDELNKQIREDKQARRKLSLRIKEKERPRRLYTELGYLDMKRDYYYDGINQRYIAVLDQVLGIEKYERIGNSVSAKLVTQAADCSYAKSAAIVTGGAISRQTVKNHIAKLQVPEKEPEQKGKAVSELHVYADEDHAHMQRPHKEKGRKSKIIPLITVSEGTIRQSRGRNKTINPMSFADENFDTKSLWKSVEGYIDMAYDVSGIAKIYIHGDGGKWIKKGLETFAQSEYVMDGYHVGKYLKKLSRSFPKQNVRQRLERAIKADDKKKADSILQELYEQAESDKERDTLSETGKYLMGNWESIVKRRTLDIPGSCTEAQVSHILSERFSRDPVGWSEEGLGKLVKLRVYIKNGGRITNKDFKRNRKSNVSYKEYADKVIKENITGAIDWSIFEPEVPIFNGASGTQVLISTYGSMRDHLIN
mgnify:CR=1 FL=1